MIRSKSLIPLLMLVPYFAPQSHAAMYRAHKLAKYLPDYGFKPIVVTTDVNYLYNEDSSLLDELPRCVEVHRSRFIEPTLRGIRMALGGADRTFAGMKRRGELAEASIRSSTSVPHSSTGGQRISRADFIRVLAEWPDRHWTWAYATKPLCRQLIQTHDIRLMYTSAVPISPLSTASSLRRDFPGLRWVADFRDPVGYGRKNTARGPLAELLERKIVRRAMGSADVITGLAGSYQGIFFDIYGVPPSRYRFIPTGLDEAYLPGATEDQRKVFIHVGEVMPDQSRYAFEVIAKAAQSGSFELKEFRLEVVGRREVNQPLIEAMLSQIPDWRLPVDFVDHVPQLEVYRRVRTARAALLIPGQGRYWWTNFAKMVDYIALGVPVIANVPAISEAREELTKAGNACFLEGESMDADAQTLLSWLERAAPKSANPGYSRRYTANRQAEDFASVFHDLIGAAGIPE